MRSATGIFRPDQLPLGWFRWALAASLGYIAGCGNLAATRVIADEPAAEFLIQLRQAKYFDTAIVYLDRLADAPGIDPGLLEAVRLERAQVYLDAAIAAPSAAEQDENFGLAEEQLKGFVRESPEHPRRSEARLRLGQLQMVRANQLLAGSATPEQRAKARKAYLSAGQTFQEITESLRQELKDLRGQKIDAKTEPEKIAERDRKRVEFLQAQLNSADAKRLAGGTFEQPATEGKKYLDQAEAQYVDLIDKYGEFVQVALANVSLGKTRIAKGDFTNAKVSFFEMLEKQEADVLRAGKMEALTGLLDIGVETKDAELSVTIDRAKRFADQLRPNEMNLPTTQAFRLGLARAHLSRFEDENLNGQIRNRAKTDARRLLLAADRIDGPHKKDTTALLAKIGIERTKIAEVEISEPENVDEALAVARNYQQQAESLDKTVKSLISKNANQEQVAKKKSELSELRTKGIEVLKSGLAMVQPDSEIEVVNNARQFLTYFLLLEARYRETAAAGSFLAKAAPGTDVGKSGGLWALSALQQLLVESGDDIDEGLAAQVRELGAFLTKTWPGDPEAGKAQGVMIRIALQKNNWSEAEELIGELPSGPEQSSMKRLTGQVLFGKSIEADREDDAETANRLRSKAIALLSEGLQGITGKLVDSQGAASALSLAKAHLRANQPAKTLEVLGHPTYGPLNLMGKVDPPSDRYVGDVYSAQLNALVSLLTDSSATSKSQNELLSEIDVSMKKLRDSAAKGGGKTRLTETLFRLARDLQESLEVAPPNRRDQYVRAFEIFLSRISKTTDDPTITEWVAQESLTLGESLMAPGERQATGRALEMIQTAASALERLRDAAKTPGPSLIFQIGRAKRLLGEYSEALNAFESILKDTPQMLDAQVEAALAYEQWAAVVKPKLVGRAYKSAIFGGRAGPNGKNVLWGWGKISTESSRSPKYKDTFFEARYHVAYCRYLMGKAENSDEIIQAAHRDVISLHAVYPDMGGADLKSKFNSLMKQIQKAIGKPATGLPKKAGK